MASTAPAGWQPFGPDLHRESVKLNMPYPALVGLHGPLGSGRATVAAHLCEAHDFRSYAIGDPVRVLLYGLDPLLPDSTSLRTRIDTDGWPAAIGHRIHGPEVNRLLDVVRSDVLPGMFGPDVWLRRLMDTSQADATLLGPAPVVISDVQTIDEARWVRNLGGVVWRIERPQHTTTNTLPGDLVDAVVKNDATELALTRRVDRALAGVPRHQDAPAA